MLINTYWVASPFGQQAAATKLGNLDFEREKLISQVSVAILSNKPGSVAPEDGLTGRALKATIPVRRRHEANLVDIQTTSIDAISIKPRVALCFFGLTRSLSFTIDSIRLNLLKPLKDGGYEVDVFLHTYNLQRLDNPWTGEDDDLNTTEWQLLEPFDYLITPQADFLAGNRYVLLIFMCFGFCQ